MTGSEFVRAFSGKGLRAWEAAALEAARQRQLTPRAWVPLTLTDGGHTATLQVQSDVLGIGPTEDSVRIPLTPIAGQSILNLQGWLMPTPWLVYQMYRAAGAKLPPTSIADLGQPNRGADMAQYALHSQAIDEQLRTAGSQPGELVSGAKKHVVISNIWAPGKVVIFGWYRPPPAPDVYDDRRPMGAPGRQPVQPKSNVHGDFYVDYSHGIRAVHPVAVVNGQRMRTEDLYRHPTLSKLVSNEGPLRNPRYPSPIAVAPDASDVPVPVATTSEGSFEGLHVVPETHGSGDLYLTLLDQGLPSGYRRG